MHTKKLEDAVNGPINEVINAMLGFGAGVSSGDQTDAARVVAGILTGAKVSIMQAMATINEMELDEEG